MLINLLKPTKKPENLLLYAHSGSNAAKKNHQQLKLNPT